MITLSLCMIVKNELDTLPRCIESARGIADEIIVVDTGSNDGTEAVAASLGCDVYNFKWIQDFSAARNFAFSKASMDYCMWLDADDVIDDAAAFIRLKEKLDGSEDTIMLPYHTAFDESGKPTTVFFRERIVRRCPHAVWHGAVHETIAPFGKIIYDESSCVRHMKPSEQTYTTRNLDIYLAQEAARAEFSPRDSFYFARELYYHGHNEKAEKILDELTAAGDGWVENLIESCRIRSLCLLAMNRRRAAVEALMRSFVYDLPRAEVCCDIGSLFMGMEQYAPAAYWYESALACPRNDASGAFVAAECYGYLPCIKLAMCHFRLGNIEKAKLFNDMAGIHKPDDKYYLLNRDFFAGLTAGASDEAKEDS